MRLFAPSDSLPPSQARAWGELRRAAAEDRLILVQTVRNFDDINVPVIGVNEAVDGVVTFHAMGLLFDGNEDWLIESWHPPHVILPARVAACNNHYQIHEVCEVKIRDGVLWFTCVNHNGHRYSGPIWSTGSTGHPPQAEHKLRANGLTKPEQVAYLVACHDGVCGMGIVVLLLRSLNDPRLHTLRERLLRHDPLL